jgi:tetratricopeptide (TPR) repeat protein
MTKLDDYLIQDISTEEMKSAIAKAVKENRDIFPVEVLKISDSTVDKYYEICRNLLSEKRFEDAINAYAFLTFLTPVYSNFWLGLGIAEQSLQNYQETILAYAMAIATDPNNIPAYVNFAQCCIALGHKDVARQLCEKALELCPETADMKSERENIKELLKLT